MNVVFWFLVIIAAFGLWWLLSPAFGGIGDAFKEYAEALKNKISNNEKENKK